MRNGTDHLATTEVDRSPGQVNRERVRMRLLERPPRSCDTSARPCEVGLSWPGFTKTAKDSQPYGQPYPGVRSAWQH